MRKRSEKELKKRNKKLNSMCLSGIHYEIEDELWLEEERKKKEKIERNTCTYSGLRSVSSYADDSEGVA